MADAMPEEQANFIVELSVKAYESTNMTKDEAYNFALRVWQLQEIVSDALSTLRS